MRSGPHGLSIENVALILYSLAAFVVIGSYLFVHLLGFGFIFHTSGGLALGAKSLSFPVLVFLFAGFYTPALPALTVFSFAWILYCACFLAAWKWRKGFPDVFGRSSSRLRVVLSNFLFSMPLLSSMALTAALGIIYSQSAVGLETGVLQLPADPFEAFLDVAYAPVIEEFAFRLLPIGLFTALIVYSAGTSVRVSTRGGGGVKSFVSSLIYPDEAKRQAGLPSVGENGILKGIMPFEWIMIIVTSAVFGLAHVLSPVGWEAGKITSAFVQGVFFAVAYVAYGFEAPLLLHWFFNYYSYLMDPAVAGEFFPGTIGLFSFLEVVILALGVLGWTVLVVVGVRKIMQRRRMSMKPKMPAYG